MQNINQKQAKLWANLLKYEKIYMVKSLIALLV